MKYCPITYDPIKDDETYSRRGLRLLSPKLTQLLPLSFSTDELHIEALSRAGKMSIQGVQAKLSAQLKIKKACFEIVDQQGHYILKPQSRLYPELPQNEAITMTLASLIGLDVPIHGLVYGKDHEMTYFIKRFDRKGHRDKVATEDFAQLSGQSRDTKYRSSMEKIIILIEKYCTFPKIEYLILFKLTLFNYLVGNEDMHLKNFSLITQKNIIKLSPAYDLLNTSIALSKPAEEIALPLNGKKNNLKKSDFFIYFAKEKLGLNEAIIEDTMNLFIKTLPQWKDYIGRSFLSDTMKKNYLTLLDNRCNTLGWN